MDSVDFNVPQDTKLERKLIAELVANPDLIPTTMELITPSTFAHEKCQNAYKEMVKMYEEREQIDIVTMSHKIEKDFFVREILTQDGYATDLSIRAHCEALASTSRKRRLYYAGLKALQLSAYSGDNRDDILAFASNLSGEIEQDEPRNGTQSLSDAIFDYGKKLQEGIMRRVPSGFPTIDKMTRGGFAAGNLVILAARPSVGKTAFMLQMARAAARNGVPALALSLEMTHVELSERMMFSTEEINASDITQDKVDWQKFERAAKEFDHYPIYLDETPQSLDEVCASITLNHRKGKCGIAFIDYVQLMSTNDANDSFYRQVTGITKRLKKLAKKLKIPIVALCQLNRSSVAEKRAPQLHDLRDSGSIEQDADIVLMLEKKEDESDYYSTRVNMYFRKNRGGLGGDICIKLRSNQNYTNFYEIIEREEIPV